MKAWKVVDAAHPKTMRLDEIETPTPGKGEVLIRVRAAAVTPTELQWYPTTHTKAGTTRDGAVPGHEFSGVVAALGSEVSEVAVGDEVFGMNDWFANGATAEFCVALAEQVIGKPARLSHAEAASVPISALTAWQGFERTALKKGERVLIHGGSGGVGIYAIQLAGRIGAKVITTAGARHAAFLKALGADQIIDYQQQDFVKEAGQVDVVFDAVGGETLQKSWAVLGSAGRLVTIAADSEGTSDDRTKKAFLLMEVKRDQLLQIAELLERGELRCVVDGVFDWMQAPAAYAGELKSSMSRGKVVLAIPA